jgi:predicted XRE-type DNA-binding protein
MTESDAADEVLAALDELVRVGRANITAWVAVMERVEEVRVYRARGLGYLEMPQAENGAATIIDAISANQERLTAAAAQFRRVLAHRLQAEGLSVAAVARAFGVSRQRVASLLAEEGHRATPGAPATPPEKDRNTAI